MEHEDHLLDEVLNFAVVRAAYEDLPVVSVARRSRLRFGSCTMAEFKLHLHIFDVI